MSNDFNFDDFQPLYPGHTPRPYHFFKVFVTVRNRATSEQITGILYLSAKRSAQWLSNLAHGRFTYPLPTDYFSFEYRILEVPDDDEILFEHITTKERFEFVTTKFIMSLCLSKRWKINIIDKIKKIYRKFITFLNSHIFINRNEIIILN